MSKKGKIYVVGIGPGNMQDITIRAYNILKNVDIISGYKTYIDLVKDEFKDKELISSGMKMEIDRCKEVLHLAESGKNIALISSGDSGIYGMAGIMLEVASESYVDIEIIPGVTSAIAGASIVGSPIMHDYATISLSDLLTDFELIKKRIEAASQADFVINIYNPKSKGRVTQIVDARDIMIKYKSPKTPVAILKNVGRENESCIISDLETFLDYDIDMFTVLIIGNSNSYVKNGKMITPRGYKI